MLLLMRTVTRPAPEEGHASVWHDAREGLRFVFRRPWLWAGMAAATISLLCTWGPWEVLVPYLVKNELGGSAGALGLVFAAGGAGAVLAAVTMGQRDLPRRPITLLYWAWAVSAFAMIGFGVSGTIWHAMLASFVMEAGITVLLVLWYTVLQRLVPGSILGRVSSLDWLISVAGVPASFALVGPIANSIGTRSTLVAAGASGGLGDLALPLPGAGLSGPRARRVDRGREPRCAGRRTFIEPGVDSSPWSTPTSAGSASSSRGCASAR